MQERDIIRYLKGIASETEQKHLEDWIHASEENLKKFNEVKALYVVATFEETASKVDTDKAYQKFRKSTHRSLPKRIHPLYKFVAAAAAVILLVIALPSLLNTQTEEQFVEPVIVNNQIKPGTNKAILTLGNGEQVFLDKGEEITTPNATSNGEEISYNSDGSGKLAYNSLSIPRGGEFFLKLSDGTQVWLNSETKLKYPVRFSKNEPRVVELLYGEAFFDVTHSSENGGSAFQVLTKNQQITVLGTEFNIQAYKNENIFTTLVKGKVTVNTDKNLVVLEPGLQSIVSRDILSEDIRIREVEINEVISWKKGFFSFNKMKLEEMMTILSRWYDLNVIYENEQKKNLIFSGELKRSHNINNLLLYLEKTGDIKFKIDGKKLYIK